MKDREKIGLVYAVVIEPLFLHNCFLVTEQERCEAAPSSFRLGCVASRVHEPPLASPVSAVPALGLG